MKKGCKAVLIVFCVFVLTLFALIIVGERTGEFRHNEKSHTIEYYCLNAVKVPFAKVVHLGKNYGVEGGRVTLIEGKSEGFIKTSDKKEYYISYGKTFDGLLGDMLYKDGLFQSDAEGVFNLDNKEYCFKNGKLFTGIYNKVYYKQGVMDNSKTGFITVDGKEYLFFDGKLFNGIFENILYSDGLRDTAKTGFYNIDGKELYIKKGRLFTGIYKKKYYLNGEFNNKSGEIVYKKQKYYIENGVCYNGFKNEIMYKDGLPDNEYNGFIVVNGKEYYFTEGVVTEVPDSVPVKILLVGNSYTYYNGMGQMLCKFIKQTGKSAIVVRATKGGWSIRSLIAKKIAYAAFMDNEQIAAGDMLLDDLVKVDFGKQNRAERWDYIVCQNNDTLDKTEEGNISFFNKYFKYVSDSSNILFNAVYYGGSASRDRYNIISKAADKCKCTLIDTVSYYGKYNSYFGRNWISDLTVRDNPCHPASKGAYLMALCIYAKIFSTDKLAKSNNDSRFIAVYNSDKGFTDEFAPNKFKRKKKTTDYSMRVTKADAKALQTFVSKYADSYLGKAMTEEKKNEKDE